MSLADRVSAGFEAVADKIKSLDGEFLARAESWDNPESRDFKLIVTQEGELRAVPSDVTRPASPTNLAGLTRLSYIRVSWEDVSGANRYRIYRNGVQIGITADNTFMDTTAEVGIVYTYSVRAENWYGMLGPVSEDSSYVIQASDNRAPEILAVRVFPLNPAPTDQVYVRVNTTDPDYQELLTTLEASEGELEATADPTLWKWNI